LASLAAAASESPETAEAALIADLNPRNDD
jgi:hypothetical protein